MTERDAQPAALAGARWITTGRSDGPLPLFRRAFEVHRMLHRATVAICGLGHFELHLNGRRVGDDVLSPGWTDYRKTCLYVVHDVTAMLHAGGNALGVMLGNGMYNVAGGRYRKFKGSFGPPRLIARLTIEYADGTSDAVVSDEAWKTRDGPIVFSCIYGGEDFDARLEPVGWDTAGCDESQWSSARVCDGPGGVLVEQDCPPIRVMRVFEPVATTEPRAGVRVYDLGQNFSGWPTVAMRGSAGATVKLITGELLDDQGLVSQKNSGSPVWFSYTARGDGEAHWQPRFSYSGFRYVQAEGDIEALARLGGAFVHSSARVTGTFECSNALLNRIHALILAAIRSNMQSVLTDCPHREKLGWLEEAHLMGPSILANLDAASLYGKICRDMRDAQADDGCVPTIAPQYTSFKPPWDVFNDSPEWGSALVICPWLVYQRTGDDRILRENYAAMQRYVDYLAGRAGEDGIVDYGLGDWYDIGPGDPGFAKLTPPAVTATATLCQDLQVMRQVAGVLGKIDDASRYARQADRTRAAFQARFFDAAAVTYTPATQATFGMALALGLVPEGHRPAIVRRLVEDIRAHGNHITAGDVGHRYVLAALAEAGRSDVVYDLLSRTDAPSYGCQIERGATALTEAWDANPKVSQNHLMLGHAEEWFHAWLAGVRVDLSQDPPRQLVIQPTPVGDVTWVRACYQTAVGQVAIDWRREEAGLRIDLEIPAGAGAATLRLPIAAGATLLEAGQPVNACREIDRLEAAKDVAGFTLAPGRYHFQSRGGFREPVRRGWEHRHSR